MGVCYQPKISFQKNCLKKIYLFREALYSITYTLISKRAPSVPAALETAIAAVLSSALFILLNFTKEPSVDIFQWICEVVQDSINMWLRASFCYYFASTLLLLKTVHSAHVKCHDIRYKYNSKGIDVPVQPMSGKLQFIGYYGAFLWKCRQAIFLRILGRL